MVEKEPQSYWHGALMAFGKMSGWIVGPILLAILVGKWLDKKFGTAPLLFAVTIGVAFLISTIGLVKEGRAYMKDVEIASEKKDTNTKTHEPESNDN